jgi:hypothetical protein
MLSKVATMVLLLAGLSLFSLTAPSHHHSPNFKNSAQRRPWWEEGDDDYLTRSDLIDLPIFPTNQPLDQHITRPVDRSGLSTFHYPYFQFQQGILDRQWVPMTYQEAHRYYTAYESCMAMADAPGQCDKLSNGSPFPHIDMHGCGIHEKGVTVDVPCPNMKGNFLRHNSTRPWPEGKQLIDIMAKMVSQRNSSSSNLIYLIGDSVTYQHYVDAWCSLSRVGLNFSTVSPYLLIANDPNRGSDDTVNQHYAHDNGPLDKEIDTTNRFFVFRHIRYYRERNHRWSDALDELKKTLHRYHQMPVQQTVVFVVNMGLHFNVPQETDNVKYQQEELEIMRENLRTYFSFFIHLAKEFGHIVIFRETTAQHFPKNNGLFSENYQGRDDFDFNIIEDMTVERQVFYSPLMNPDKRRTDYGPNVLNRPDVHFCKPLRTKQELHANNWRNREVFKILKELDPNHEYVHVARFHEVTAGRHDFHASGTDCTHFCGSPIVWYPLWEEIYGIIDDVFTKRESVPFVRRNHSEHMGHRTDIA